MATPGTPQNMQVQTANQQILISWALSPGATTYTLQRSLDNVSFSTVATITGSPLATSYVDTAIILGVQYWYKVAASDRVGLVTFTGQPIAGETVTINNVVFTAVASGAIGLQFNVGATTEDTIANLASAINSNISNSVVADSSPTVLTLTALSTAVTQLSTALTNTTVTAFTTGGTSPYTNSQAMTAAPQGEMALGAIRLASRQNADRVNSNFVTDVEWNNFIRMACYELYDLLITVYEDLYVARPIQFTTDGSQSGYDLPTGSNQFYYADDLNGGLITPPAFYKLLGVDLQVQNVNNGYVTINKFNFIDRNRFVFPNSASTIYGVFNCQYRVMGKKIQFIPTPSANQGIRLWYIPRLLEMLQDTDTSDISISGWIRYVIVRASKYALDKEESDSTKQDAELMFLKGRIEETAANRDAGQPDSISDTRASRGYWGSNGGWPNGGSGGF